MDYVIRIADIEDYDGICQVLKNVDRLHSRALPEIFREYNGPARTRQYLQAMMKNESSEILVAESGGKIIGTVHVYIRETPDINVLTHRAYGIMDDLVVCEDMRGCGIGKALMEKAHDWLRDRSINRVELNVWEFNRNAIEFYEGLGYKTLSRRMGMDL